MIIDFLKKKFQILEHEKSLIDKNADFPASKFKIFLRNCILIHLLISNHQTETNGKVKRPNKSFVM